MRSLAAVAAASISLVVGASASAATPPLPTAAQHAAAQAQVGHILATSGTPGLAGLVRAAQAWKAQPGGGVSQEQLALLQAIESAPGASTTQSDSVAAPAPTPLAPVTAADPCWYTGNHIWASWRWYLAGVKVADVAVNHGYWCGDGSRITQNGLNYYWNQWAQFPWCVDSSQKNQGWDAPNYSWTHGHVHGDSGDTYGVGCLHDGASGSAALRINGAGGHDTYNDWGF